MKKNIILMTLVLVLLTAASVSASQQIYVGQNGTWDLSSAMNQISQNAGDVTLYLTANISQNTPVEIPNGLRGLTSVTIAGINGVSYSVNLNGGVLCADGVDLTIDRGVSITNGYLVGGNCLATQGTVEAEESAITINGSADYVFGGGLAMGYGAVSNVKEAYITIMGSANVVHGGGYAYNGGQTYVTNEANIFLANNSKVNTAAYGGGYADGYGSVAGVNAAVVTNQNRRLQVNGQNGYAANNGTAYIGQQPNNGSGKVVPVVPNNGNNGYNGYANNTVINVGYAQAAADMTAAMAQIPSNAGNVVLNLVGNFTQGRDVTVPDDRGIVSLTVRASNGNSEVVFADENTSFYANGIPVTIERGVTFTNGIIYGGANVPAGAQSYLQSTNLNIAGKVTRVAAGSKAKGSAATSHITNTYLNISGKVTGWVYNGSYAMYGGYAVVDNTATFVMEQGATAEQSIAGGGISFGEGSQSVVKNANLQVAGSVVYAIYLGGYGDQGGVATTDNYAYLTLLPTGNVGQSVWYGGRAYKNAQVYVAAASSDIQGRVGATVHKEGRGSDGGTSIIGRIY